MAYDETLAKRICTELQGQPDLTERKMFGGFAYMIGGNMCCCVTDQGLMGTGRRQSLRGCSGPTTRRADGPDRPADERLGAGGAGGRSVGRRPGRVGDAGSGVCRYVAGQVGRAALVVRRRRRSSRAG